MSELVDGAGNALTLRTLLAAMGCSEDELDQAEATGTMTLLAVERLVLPEPSYDVVEAAARSGLTTEAVEQFWRSLGFPQPHPGERVFTDEDVANLANVAELIKHGVVKPDLAIQMTRVIGSSIARIASAQVDAITAQEVGDADPGSPLAANAGALLPTIPRVMEQVWRRHLQASARRRMLRTADGEDTPTVVGFADLVGFTALSQQLSDEELAAIVGRFESLSYDVVTANGGRVVKMIGDEVMFAVEDVRAAAEIALALADASHDDEDLSDVRVGLAIGPVLEREGDLFGPTVNLASRITNIALPGSVLTSNEVHDLLADDEVFTWRAMRPRYLKNIGRVALWVMRRSDAAPPGMLSTMADRRREARASFKEAIAGRLLEQPDA